MMLACVFFAVVPLEPGAPTRISIGPGDFGQQTETTPQNRALVTGRGLLLVDTPNLFGTIAVDAQLRVSYVLAERAWLNLNLAVLEYRNVINASITASHMALGPLTASLHYQIVSDERWAVAPYVRLLLPTTTATVYARQLGLEVGVSGSYLAHPSLSFLWAVMMPAGSTILSSRATAFVWPTLAVELAAHPWRWGQALVGMELRLGFDPKGVLEYFAPKACLRFYPVSGLVLEVKAMLPFGGLERIDQVAGFSAGWIW